MKKTLIALAVSTVAIASGAQAAELYNQDGTSLEIGGRIEGRLSMQDGKGDDASRVRVHIAGKTAINDSLYGMGFYEAELKTNDNGGYYNNNPTDSESDGTDIVTRLAYAGLGGNFGLVSYGKTSGSLGVITDFTDIFSGIAGNTAADKLKVADRTDNMLAYKGQFDDLALRASYRFADRSTNNGSYDDNNQDGYSLSAIYAFGDTGLTAGAGYAEQDEANEYMLAASYTIADFYFAGVFTDGEKQASATDNSTQDYTGYELAAAYTLGQTVFTAAYNNAENESDTAVDNLAFETAYFFKPNFRAWVSYNFNLIDEGDTTGPGATASKADSEDEVGLGLRYDF